MPSPELTVSAFVRLAQISNDRRQLLPRNKFLILAGAAACAAGWLPAAERCRAVVLADNPSHMLNRFPSFPEALRSTEFQVFLKQLTKFCSTEKAEHLLTAQGIESLLLSESEAIDILARLIF
jgi:hypothetical protein